MGHTHYHNMKRWASRIMLSFLLIFAVSTTSLAESMTTPGAVIPIFYLCVDHDKNKDGLRAMAEIIEAAKLSREAVQTMLNKKSDGNLCTHARVMLKVVDLVMSAKDFENSIVEVWILQNEADDKTWYGMTRYLKNSGVDS